MKLAKSFRPAFLIVFWSFAVHIPGLFSPLRDYHAYRQCQTASMARNYVAHGMRFMRPEVDTAGLPVRAGTEFPIYSYTLALLFKVFGTHEILGRALSMVFAAWGALFLYGFVRRRLGVVIGHWSALVMCTLPVHVYFTRTVQPEPMALWGLLGFVYYADLWLTPNEKRARYWLYALLLGATAPLLKLPYLYLVGPIWLLLAYEKGGWAGVFRTKWLLLMGGMLWATYSWYDYAKSAPVVLLPLGHDEHLTNLKPILSWKLWQDQFISRFPEIVFTYAGLLLAGFGLYNIRRAKALRFIVVWAVISVVYVVLLGQYGLTHKYTLLPVTPLAAILIACGVSMLLSHAAESPMKRLLCITLLIGIPLHTALRINHWYKIEYNYLARAEQLLDATGDYDSLVLVVTHEMPQHLYYLNRYGYSLEPRLWTKEDVDEMWEKGVRFVLLPKEDNGKRLLEWKTVLKGKADLMEENDDFLLYKSSERHG